MSAGAQSQSSPVASSVIAVTSSSVGADSSNASSGGGATSAQNGNPVPATKVEVYTATQSAINTAKALCAGGLAGAVSRTATAPLERLKVMRQVQAANAAYTDVGMLGAFRKMAKEEGLMSWWKGNGTNVARIAPSSAIQFATFDIYKRALAPLNMDVTIQSLISGALAGATASTVCYPLDLVRSFLSVQTAGKQYNGIVDCMRSVVRSEGFFGLYRGLLPTLFGISPYVAINFAVFDSLKRRFLPSPDHPNFNVINFSLGAVAGGTAAALTYPTDLVRRRMQLQGFQGSGGFDLPQYGNARECIKIMWKQEGINGFYKGLFPCICKVVPSMAIAFMTYEGLRKYWTFDPPKGAAISKS